MFCIYENPTFLSNMKLPNDLGIVQDLNTAHTKKWTVSEESKIFRIQ